MHPPARLFALLVSAFLIFQGIWELGSPVVFGAFTSNTVHGVIHIALGVIGLFSVARGAVGGFLGFLGLLLLIVGILWFIPQTRHLPTDLLNANRSVAIFNVILGAVSLLVSRDARRHPPAFHPPGRHAL